MAEQRRQYPVERQVAAHLGLIERMAREARALGGKAHVPGFKRIDAQFATGKFGQIGQFGLGQRAGARGKVGQERFHRIGAFGHLGGERQAGSIALAQEFRCPGAQGQERGHARPVVKLPGVGPLVRCARGIGLLHVVTQRAILGIGQHCHHHRGVERDQPALLVSLGLGSGSHASQVCLGNAGQAACVGQVEAPRLGRVHHGIGIFGGQAALLHLVFGKVTGVITIQCHARKLEIAQRQFARAGGERIERGRIDRADRLIQRAILAHGGKVRGDQRLRLCLRGAQFRGVGHRQQMAHHAPGLADAAIGLFLERQHGRIAGPRHARGHGGLVIGDRGSDRRHDVIGADVGKARLAMGGQQGKGSVERGSIGQRCAPARSLAA